jgi:asparagine synthase (glutamine-hydrolysing)
MCGFVCLWKIDDPELAHRMINKISHRGPDELRVSQANGPAVMAHCRLSIIGLENGTQPIYSGENVLVANGETYNYAALRAMLGEGAFETQSDSEAILQLFRAGGSRSSTVCLRLFSPRRTGSLLRATPSVSSRSSWHV